jgi:hypothetical protein
MKLLKSRKDNVKLKLNLQYFSELKIVSMSPLQTIENL